MISSQRFRSPFWWGFVCCAAVLVLCAVTTPMALLSVLDDVTHPPDLHTTPVTPSDTALDTTFTRLNLTLVSLDEVNRVANLRYNGYHTCESNCTYRDRVTFYAFRADPDDARVVPASESVITPATSSEVSGTIRLPVRGHVLEFPFDSYNLGLGLVHEREQSDKSFRPLSAAETRRQLMVTVTDQVPRMDLKGVSQVDPTTVKPEGGRVDYAFASVITLERPPYLRVVAILVVLLSAAVAVFVVATRPFDQLILNAGALVLGVWGARNLVLGGLPPDVTLVDTLLTVIVIFLLLAITLRGMNYFHRRAELTWVPWAKFVPAKKEATRECPECLSRVPAAARRCAHCTSVLEPAGTAISA